MQIRLSMSCRQELRQELSLEQRLELRCALKLELKHPDFPNARAGTPENVRHVAEYMRQNRITGVLFGGCAREPMIEEPRKDIDVLILNGPKLERFEEGIDWWNPIAAGFRNANGALIPLALSYSEKLDSGLYISRPLSAIFYGSSTNEVYEGVAESPSASMRLLPGRTWKQLPNGLFVLDAKEKELKAIPRSELDLKDAGRLDERELWDYVKEHNEDGIMLVKGMVKVDSRHGKKCFCDWVAKEIEFRLPVSESG